jgi:predicted O-methyltransferase YrrM
MNLTIERAVATAGFMSETELTYLASLAQTCDRIAEVGTWRGRSARAFADNMRGYLTCIDTWADDAYGAVFPGDAPDLCQHPDWLWKEFHKNLADWISEGRIRTLRMPSVSGAQTCWNERFDLIFIDAGHAYQNVIDDIAAWRPLLTEDGVLCGHDYNPVHHPEVIRAVDELVPQFRVVDTIWTTAL